MKAIQNSANHNFRFMDRVQAQGRLGTMNVYELFDSDPLEIRELKTNTKPEFECGLELYYQGQFAEAGVELGKVLKLNPDDKVAQIHMKRAGHYMASGVPDNWTGVEPLEFK